MNFENIKIALICGDRSVSDILSEPLRKKIIVWIKNHCDEIAVGTTFLVPAEKGGVGGRDFYKYKVHSFSSEKILLEWMP